MGTVTSRKAFEVIRIAGYLPRIVKSVSGNMDTHPGRYIIPGTLNNTGPYGVAIPREKSLPVNSHLPVLFTM
jgi:hypothetical protein